MWTGIEWNVWQADQQPNDPSTVLLAAGNCVAIFRALHVVAEEHLNGPRVGEDGRCHRGRLKRDSTSTTK